MGSSSGSASSGSSAYNHRSSSGGHHNHSTSGSGYHHASITSGRNAYASWPLNHQHASLNIHQASTGHHHPVHHGSVSHGHQGPPHPGSIAWDNHNIMHSMHQAAAAASSSHVNMPPGIGSSTPSHLSTSSNLTSNNSSSSTKKNNSESKASSKSTSKSKLDKEKAKQVAAADRIALNSLGSSGGSSVASSHVLSSGAATHAAAALNQMHHHQMTLHGSHGPHVPSLNPHPHVSSGFDNPLLNPNHPMMHQLSAQNAAAAHHHHAAHHAAAAALFASHHGYPVPPAGTFGPTGSGVVDGHNAFNGSSGYGAAAGHHVASTAAAASFNPHHHPSAQFNPRHYPNFNPFNHLTQAAAASNQMSSGVSGSSSSSVPSSVNHANSYSSSSNLNNNHVNSLSSNCRFESSSSTPGVHHPHPNHSSTTPHGVSSSSSAMSSLQQMTPHNINLNHHNHHSTQNNNSYNLQSHNHNNSNQSHHNDLMSYNNSSRGGYNNHQNNSSSRPSSSASSIHQMDIIPEKNSRSNHASVSLTNHGSVTASQNHVFMSNHHSHNHDSMSNHSMDTSLATNGSDRSSSVTPAAVASAASATTKSHVIHTSGELDQLEDDIRALTEGSSDDCSVHSTAVRSDCSLHSTTPIINSSHMDNNNHGVNDHYSRSPGVYPSISSGRNYPSWHPGITNANNSSPNVPGIHQQNNSHHHNNHNNNSNQSSGMGHMSSWDPHHMMTGGSARTEPLGHGTSSAPVVPTPAKVSKEKKKEKKKQNKEKAKQVAAADRIALDTFGPGASGGSNSSSCMNPLGAGTSPFDLLNPHVGHQTGSAAAAASAASIFHHHQMASNHPLYPVHPQNPHFNPAAAAAAAFNAYGPNVHHQIASNHAMHHHNAMHHHHPFNPYQLHLTPAAAATTSNGPLTDNNSNQRTHMNNANGISNCFDASIGGNIQSHHHVVQPLTGPNFNQHLNHLQQVACGTSFSSGGLIPPHLMQTSPAAIITSHNNSSSSNTSAHNHEQTSSSTDHQNKSTSSSNSMQNMISSSNNHSMDTSNNVTNSGSTDDRSSSSAKINQTSGFSSSSVISMDPDVAAAVDLWHQTEGSQDNQTDNNATTGTIVDESIPHHGVQQTTDHTADPSSNYSQTTPDNENQYSHSNEGINLDDHNSSQTTDVQNNDTNNSGNNNSGIPDMPGAKSQGTDFLDDILQDDCDDVNQNNHHDEHELIENNSCSVQTETQAMMTNDDDQNNLNYVTGAEDDNMIQDDNDDQKIMSSSIGTDNIMTDQDAMSESFEIETQTPPVKKKKTSVKTDKTDGKKGKETKSSAKDKKALLNGQTSSAKTTGTTKSTKSKLSDAVTPIHVAQSSSVTTLSKVNCVQSQNNNNKSGDSKFFKTRPQPLSSSSSAAVSTTVTPVIIQTIPHVYDLMPSTGDKKSSKGSGATKSTSGGGSKKRKITESCHEGSLSSGSSSEENKNFNQKIQNKAHDEYEFQDDFSPSQPVAKKKKNSASSSGSKASSGIISSGPIKIMKERPGPKCSKAKKDVPKDTPVIPLKPSITTPIQPVPPKPGATTQMKPVVNTPLVVPVVLSSPPVIPPVVTPVGPPPMKEIKYSKSSKTASSPETFKSAIINVDTTIIKSSVSPPAKVSPVLSTTGKTSPTTGSKSKTTSSKIPQISSSSPPTVVSNIKQEPVTLTKVSPVIEKVTITPDASVIPAKGVSSTSTTTSKGTKSCKSDVKKTSPDVDLSSKSSIVTPMISLSVSVTPSPVKSSGGGTTLSSAIVSSVSVQSMGTNTPRRRSQDKKALTIREGHMRTYDFVVSMDESKAEKPVIWRIEGKSLLQKFEPSESDPGIIVYCNTSSVSITFSN